MIASKLYKEFFNSEKTGGLLLIVFTLGSIIITNSGLGEMYTNFWSVKFAGMTVGHWINDGLMAIFFLLIGLELEREIYKGELSNLRDALLPIIAAIGGMIFPALFYFLFNRNTEYMGGMGIPTATDIAFALGILSMLGKRVPTSLKVFLTALAVIDDLGAIIIIALFYTKSLAINMLIAALVVFVILLIINKLGVKLLWIYLIGGILMWFFMLKSGVHATISGVLLAFAIPYHHDDTKSPSFRLQHILHKPTAYIILPVFALANTAIILSSDFSQVILERYSLGIAFGLIIGKPLGIFITSYLAVLAGISILPSDISWKSILGVGLLAGIGFTMSIFITLLAFDDFTIINNAKLIILFSSMISGIIGFIILKLSLNSEATE